LHHVHRAQHRFADILTVAPNPLVVSGKSNAIRAGLAIVKLPGAAAKGFFRVTVSVPGHRLGDVEVFDTVLLRRGERHEQISSRKGKSPA